MEKKLMKVSITIYYRSEIENVTISGGIMIVR